MPLEMGGDGPQAHVAGGVFGVNCWGHTSAVTGRRSADCDRWNVGRREFGHPPTWDGNGWASEESQYASRLPGRPGLPGAGVVARADAHGYGRPVSSLPGTSWTLTALGDGESLEMVSFGITEGGGPTRELFQREVAYRDTHARSATLAGHGSPSPARPAGFRSWTGGGGQGVV